MLKVDSDESPYQLNATQAIQDVSCQECNSTGPLSPRRMQCNSFRDVGQCKGFDRRPSALKLFPSPLSMLLAVDFLLVRVGCCLPNTQPRLKSWYDQFEKREGSSAGEAMAMGGRHKFRIVENVQYQKVTLQVQIRAWQKGVNEATR